MSCIAYSFIELVPVLLKKEGAKFLLSERFNQDRLEAYFGQQRARGRRSTNPTVLQHLHNGQAIRLGKSLVSGKSSSIAEPRRKRLDDESVYREQCSPLPKRPKRAKARPCVLTF